MDRKPPIEIYKGEWERGLWWTVLLSAALHVGVLVVVLLLPQNLFVQPSPPLVSYTVDLVDPNKLGGTNLVAGSKGKVDAPPLAQEKKAPPPEEKVPPPPPPPPPEEKPKEVAKAEPVVPVVPDAEPDDPNALKVNAPATFTATPRLAATATARSAATATAPPAAKAEPTKRATPTVIVKTPTPAPKKTPTMTKSEIAAAKKAEELEKKQAAEEAKKQAEADQLKKAVELARQKAQAEEKKHAAEDQKREAEARDIDAKIMNAVKRKEQQTQEGVAGGSEGNHPGERPGGAISMGPGAGAGGLQADPDFILYTRLLQDRAREAWHWAGNEDLSAAVSFKVSETGEVFDIHLARSSGDKAFDASVERAVRGINPVPPPPEKHLKLFSEEGFLMDLGKKLQR